MKKLNTENLATIAPICTLESANNWFEIDHPQPYMLECPVVRSDKRSLIPAVTHIDNTARLQTVSEKENRLLYKVVEKS